MLNTSAQKVPLKAFYAQGDKTTSLTRVVLKCGRAMEPAEANHGKVQDVRVFRADTADNASNL